MSLKINQEIIDDELIQEEFQYVKVNYEQNTQKKLPNDEELMKLVKENIIRRVILRQEVDKKNIPVDEENLKKEITLFKTYNQKSSEMQEGEILDYVRTQCQVNIFLEEISNDIEQPNEEEVKNFFKDNKESYKQDEKINLSQIVINYKSENDKKKAIENLTSAKELFNSKKKFSSLVEKFSDIKEEEGSLGWIDKSSLNEELQKTLFALKINHISDIFEDRNCLYLFHVNDKKEFNKNYFEENRDIIYQDLIEELKVIKIDAYIYGLFQKSEIIDEETI